MQRKEGSQSNPSHHNRNSRGGGKKNRSGGFEGGESTNKNSRWGNNSTANSQHKFDEAHAKLQLAIKKHVKDYESSDEEEELEITSILGSVLQSYAAIGGSKNDLGRTQHFLEDVFQSGAAICLICIGSVKRADAIWSCEACYCFLHLQCTQRWAKDSLLHQKQALEDVPRDKLPLQISWPCPKCRKEYSESFVPQKYFCFCGQSENPQYHPWLIPHSCGEACGAPLQPLCGHKCLLLCHPGPCPPCPKTIRVSCHCGKENPKPQRCSNKQWSCGAPCGRVLSCGIHRCSTPCHPDDCDSCPRTSDQRCACGRSQQKRPCSSPTWHCEEICDRKLSCGHHSCKRKCHAGVCGPCPLTIGRTCPCGKRPYELPCTEEAPTCGDTCGLPLNCGVHTCPERCHRDKCGTCLEVTVKRCRCGLHQKELPCAKEYLCETKCKLYKDCGRHPCNRKCCDLQCPPCEKICGRTLTCGQHKCESVCHRGPCYPCPLTVSVRCRCGSTTIKVPCGRQRRTKPPTCTKLCMIPPDCHHEARKPHKCHFNACPICDQVCGKVHSNCEHTCPAKCHSAVWMEIEQQAPAGPWERTAPQIERRELPCPPCKVPVKVPCPGGHVISDMACHEAKPLSCGRQCGRTLECGNHSCSFECHAVPGPESCETCRQDCTLARPEDCSHPCPLPCHPAPCPPCLVNMRMRCHCGVGQLFIKCLDWTNPEADRISMMSCTNPCPKNYPCGHKCSAVCHPGECPDSEKCNKKSKIYCACKRLKKDLRCSVIRSNEATVECDEICLQLKEEKEKKLAEELERQRYKEEIAARLEAERFRNKIEGSGKRKNRDRHNNDRLAKTTSGREKLTIFCVSCTSIIVCILAICYMNWL